MKFWNSFDKTLLILISILYIIWSSFFIFSSSFIAIDGNRYFSLLDDAMISMRYAWNLSHGNGLVWNQGEYVEGYSNFLMTLLMSVFTGALNKQLAVLGIQIFGVFTVLTVGLITRKIFLNFENEKNSLLSVIVFVLTVFYYPLSYWSLMGMESGLLSLFFLLGILKTLSWLSLDDQTQLQKAAICFGFAFLIRNDAIIYGGLTILFLGGFAIYKKDVKVLKSIFMMGIILGAFVFFQTAFRWFYYGEILPNTYYLKVDQIPLLIRLNDGIVYSLSFIRENFILLVFSILGALFFQTPKKWYFMFMILLAGAYQTYVGGDTWGRWRFMIPVIPLTLILSIEFVKECFTVFVNRLKEKPFFVKLNRAKVLIFIIFSLFIWFLTALPYMEEITFQTKINEAVFNQHNVNKAVALNAVLTKDASIGVFWAGSIPYYTNYYAIDFLGKSDKHIAKLYPHLPTEIFWLYQITIPGHNKYDLNYSIKVLQPVYIQRYYWIGQNLRRYAVENYVRFEYQGTTGSTTLMLQKDSAYVNWDKGVIVEWDE